MYTGQYHYPLRTLVLRLYLQLLTYLLTQTVCVSLCVYVNLGGTNRSRCKRNLAGTDLLTNPERKN